MSNQPTRRCRARLWLLIGARCDFPRGHTGAHEARRFRYYTDWFGSTEGEWVTAEWWGLR